MESNGGYECDFVETPPDRVLCKICQNPCRDAYLTGCCGTNFCHSCLQQLKKGTAVNKACPMCREEKFRIFPNKGLDREIKSLSIHCDNRRDGCTWSGEVNDVEKHITADCQFVEVNCPSKCGLKLKRQCVEQHVAKECPCHCQYCGTTGKKEMIEAKHKKNCPQYPRPCPNGCKLGVVPSAGMAAHRKVCPMELVQCEYYVVGCESLVARGDIETHYNQKLAEHLSLMKSKLASTAKAVAESDKKFISIGKELGRTRKVMGDAQSTCDQLAETVSDTETELRWLVDEEYLSTKNEVSNLRFALSMQYEQAMGASFYINALFSRYNSCMLAIMILFACAYITQLRMTNQRLLQSEQYMWLKTLDHVSGLSMATSDRRVPFIFKIHDQIQAQSVDSTSPLVIWSNFTFHLLSGEYEILMTVEYFKRSNAILISLSLKKDKSEEIGEWPLKVLFTIELLNQLYNNDHYVIPMLVNSEFDVCELSNEESMMLCTIYFISMEQLVQESLYFSNNTVYFRISQVSYKEGVWNVYNWFGPTAFNLLLSYKVWILWIAIMAVGVMMLTMYHGAWLGVKPTVYIVLPVILMTSLWSITPS